MNVDTVFIPSALQPDQLVGRSVVVLDVLRATTTITAALAAGVEKIHVFDSVESARAGAKACGVPLLLCGEIKCLTPEGFDMGNSPTDFTADRCGGRTVYMSTTNGTRALYAAASAGFLIAGALVNAPAVARLLVNEGRDVTLLCAGTDGNIAAEDVIGAGAIAEGIAGLWEGNVDETDATQIARAAYRAVRDGLPTALSKTVGGQNVIHAGLEQDVEFAARVGVFDVVGVVNAGTFVVSGRLA